MQQIYRAFSSCVRVSVLIPSLDGDRGGNLQRLLDDLAAQTLKDMEVIVTLGVRPQGKAINAAAARARGEILVIMDDDARPAAPDTLASLVAVFTTDPEIGMAGASIVQPPGGNRLQRRTAREMPRLSMPVVDRPTRSDLPCHGCCAIPRALFDEVGRESEAILRGLDPDLRQRIRRRNRSIVLAPRTVVYHPVPGTVRGLIALFFRNGRGSAYIQKRHPELVFDTLERTTWNGEAVQTPFALRVARYPLRWIGRLCRGQVVRFLGDAIYAAGFVAEWLKPRRAKGQPAG